MCVLQQQRAISAETKEEARRILETMRTLNLDEASPDEKRDLIAKLGIKVYPYGDGKVVRISSILKPNPNPLEISFSPQKISMASPKL